MQKILLGAYWGPRRETLNKCGTRVERWLAATYTAAAETLNWCEAINGGRRKAYAVIENQVQIRELLFRSRHFADFSGRLMADLGFSPSLLLRDHGKVVATCNIHCGCWSKWVKNVVVIDGLEKVIPTIDLSSHRQLVTSTAEIWQPEWAGVFSRAAIARRTDPNLPFVDWMVYVSRKLMPEPPKLKLPAIVEPCAEGTLIIVQKEPPDPENAAQQRHVKNVAKKVWEAVQMK